MQICVVIITRNEELNIGRCLDSLHEVADEIIIVDALSTDRTEEICRGYPNLQFFSRTWAGYAAAKNFGDAQAQSDFILSIDADEMLSEPLRLEILKNKPILRGAYQMPRLNHIGDKAIKFSGWYPDVKVRLFPKLAARWEGDFVHEKLVYKGEIHSLKHDLLHYTYQSFKQFDKKMQYYATLSAQEMFSKGKHWSFIFMLFKAIFKFLNIAVLKLGIFDGIEGLKIAYEAAKSVYWKYNVLRKLYREKALEESKS